MILIKDEMMIFSYQILPPVLNIRENSFLGLLNN